MRRAWAAAVVAVALALGVVLASAPPAAAHATLVSSDPAEGEVLDTAPDVVTFTFDEPVRLSANSVQVFDAQGEPLDSEANSRDVVVSAELPADLPDGSYVVVWQVVSADGHPIAGSLTFAVGAPSLEVAPPQIPTVETGPVRTALSITQALLYLGLLTSAGLCVFLAWALAGVRVDDVVRRRVVRVAWWAAGVAGLGAFSSIPLAGAYQQALPLNKVGEAEAVDLALAGGDVVVFLIVVAGLVAALVSLGRPGWSRLTIGAALVAGVSPALVGHSRAIDPVWLMATTDVLHLLCGVVWLGSLLGLGLVLGSLSGRERDAAVVLTRFSSVAAVLLGLLALSGTFMGWRILEGWGPLFQTGYGRVLLVKVGVAAVVAAVAAYNRWVLLPRAVAGVGHTERRDGVLGVRTVVRVEAALLVVVVVLTGFLTNLSPREAPVVREPVASRAAAALAGDIKVLVTAAPGRRGPNTLLVQLQNEAGEPADQFAEPVVRVSLEGDDVDLGEQPVTPVATGTFEVQAVLPSAGVWQVQVSVRTSEFDNPVAVVEVPVS